MALLAFILSLLLIQFSLPFFNELSGKQMYVLWNEPVFWMLGTSFAIFSGLLAGIYPAFYLSSFNPVKVLKGTFRIGKMASLPRKTLIIIQFTFSVLMIIGTIVVFRQIQYAKNRPIGYNRAGLVMIRPYSEDIHNHFESFRNDLMQSGVITEIAESGNQITRGSRTSGGLAWQGKDQNMVDEFATFAVTSQYGKAVNWQLKDGKDFSQSLASDQFGLILNETAVKYMRLKNPVGQIMSWNDKKYTVLGVTKDMIVESPYEPIKPTIFYISTEPGIINVKINPKTSAIQALNTIEATYKKYALGQPFDFQFVDQEYAKKFGNEERIGKLASSFAALAIFISCLGLFGMASFMAEQRIKEIGVRKVLGATVFNLWSLLTKDFISMVIISIMIASPVAYYFMHNWLQNYSFHTRMDWWIFVVTAAGSLTITLLTTSIQSVKAALTNPTKSLKAE
jgi:ABC-type antimicrobial peptide transport system permease subunit